MTTNKQLRKNITQYEDDIETLSKTIKELRTIINQLIIGIGYSEDPKLNRLVTNLFKKYGPCFLSLGE